MTKGDKILLRKIRSGDRTVFELLFKKNYQKLYAIGLQILKDEDLVQDIIQNVFTYIWEKRKIISFKSNLEAYLVVKLKSLCLNALKKKTQHSQKFSSLQNNKESLDYYFFQNEKVTEHLSSVEFQLQIDKAINNLSDQQKKIIRMYRIDDLSTDEIVKETGLTKRTVETHIYNAIKILKKELQSLLK